MRAAAERAPPCEPGRPPHPSPPAARHWRAAARRSREGPSILKPSAAAHGEHHAAGQSLRTTCGHSRCRAAASSAAQ
eukprot:417581-Lingulodinium_polyedra.AAC.1